MADHLRLQSRQCAQPRRQDRASQEWSLTALDTIVDAVRDQFSLEAERFHIYGHSAGAQFVHRYILHTGAARVERAVASNAGWYMLPCESFAFHTDFPICRSARRR